MSKKKQSMHTHLATLLDRATEPNELYGLGTEIGLNTNLDKAYKHAFACFEQTANPPWPRGETI